MAASSNRKLVMRYDPSEIDEKWQSRWASDGLYQINDDDSRPKWYELTMYPYPSGDLHIGHWYAMAPSDCHARYMRMKGYNVLHPMGFDAFGLPAENAAIKGGAHPYDSTMDNIMRMRTQLRSMGTIYDWDREIVTSDPKYYKWNQWLFLQFYKNGLAYRAFAPANWCPSCQTVLANEQVEEGKCERCSNEIERRELDQWFFRITDYAEELLDHSKKEWPNRVDMMQTNWIGRSEGVEIDFDISEYGLDQDVLTTFTTRIDTVFGVTFIVMAPEHPLVDGLATKENTHQVKDYVRQARRQSEIERMSTLKVKTGVFIGAYATNKLSGERVPILISDYVLQTYGTGVVMGVPAHDQRDFEFALMHNLPIKIVVAPTDWDGTELTEAFVENGVQINSDTFDGMNNNDGKEAIADHIEVNGFGRRKTQYRMRDWLISRQRYWGTPIPIVYCDHCGTVPVPEDELPVLLPRDAEFLPTGESPLSRHQEFVNTNCPTCNESAIRETDTMDTFVDSSWYQFRFTSPSFDGGMFNSAVINKWAPVDQYTGGAEHAVMHLLYARFFTKAMRDIGLLDFDEPFVRLYNQGHIIADHQKMSKSRGNVIAPDKYVSQVGADVVRCYLMFLGPWDQGGDWSDSGLNGMARWINRVWDIFLRDANLLDETTVVDEAVRDIKRKVHKTIRRVSVDLEKFKFNTAIAALMELSRSLDSFWEDKTIGSEDWKGALKNLLLMMAPFAPHVAEELWVRTGRFYSVHSQPFPQWDSDLAADDMVTLVVQVNGRLRDTIEVPVSISEEQALDFARKSRKVIQYIEEKDVVKVIYVSGKLINMVVRDQVN